MGQCCPHGLEERILKVQLYWPSSQGEPSSIGWSYLKTAFMSTVWTTLATPTVFGLGLCSVYLDLQIRLFTRFQMSIGLMGPFCRCA